MSTQWKKTGIILIGYYITLILNACCNCPTPDLPYFDYKAITVEAYSNNVNANGDEFFGFMIGLDSIQYLTSAEESNVINWGLVNTAYACSCEEDGDWGEKYPVSAINIYADSIFDTSVAENEPLNKLFVVNKYYNDFTRQYETTPLDSIQYDPPRLHIFQQLFLASEAKPVAFNRPYYFEIELIKANGSVLRSRVGPMIWKK